ncbi:hypothetical protein [Kitasatospora fiedleri]|uniref:hypothetical protein n=1 Tax=Kitasatospora fiedleri TaxID=2991545 RepID=UPI00249B1239|nr:hypothetical protein [Kitasatospora fiedleri]
MARGTIAVSTADRAGTVLPAATDGDATNGHAVVNDGRTALLVKNGGSTVSRTVTIRLSGTLDGLAVTATRTKSVAVGAEVLLGPFPRDVYGSSLLVDVDNAELKIRAIKLP